MIQSICICGAGTMGSGIAQVAAQAGCPTILYDLSELVLEKAKAAITKNLQSLANKGKITSAESNAIYERILFSNNWQLCKADLFVEAIIEKLDLKISLFNQLAAINKSSTIFASNTSSLSITAIAEKIENPERVIGMHFFNPAPAMQLVEVVKTKFTNNSTQQAVMELVKRFKKTPVLCNDFPGFIVNRVARPFYIEALRIAEEQPHSYEQIDELMKAAGFKMGPFELMDLIGNDVNYAVSCSVFEQLGRPLHLQPSYLQQEKVEKGELGVKTGKGFYTYSEE